MHRQFAGRLTARDAKQYIQHRVQVPEGTTRLELRLAFSPARAYGIDNLITLTLFDPTGFRGARLCAATLHEVHLEAGRASPGYLPGPLPAGEWTAEIDTHMIMPAEPLQYTLEVTASSGAVRAPGRRPDAPGPALPGPAAPGEPASVENRSAGGPDVAARPDTAQEQDEPEEQRGPARTPAHGPGWYRGDLHTHTVHSDAGERTVAELVASAREAGLDFVFLTDHNTTSGLAEMDAASTPGLLAAGGIELTTYWGHAVVLGAREWIDWRVRPGTGQMARLAAEAAARGQPFIIAHPQSPGDPACTGCSWRFGDMMPGNARLVEIWNGPWGGDSNNEAALALYYDWLNQGYRLAATAGTDTHDRGAYNARPGLNVVWAEALSEGALLAGLAAGHVVLSAGPVLRLEADGGAGVPALPGDTLHGPATLAARWADCPPGATLRVIANGRCLATRPAGAAGEHTWSMEPADAAWVLVELRDGRGEMLAITNPIFFEESAGSRT